jgi:hypothetical protein
LQSQNELLRSKLYAKTLDTKTINFKIESIKECLDGTQDSRDRLKATMVEKFADFIFKVANLGVPDMKAEIGKFGRTIYEL